jgi:ribosome-binding ATPase YchF (GTP1/OBG family)
MSEIPANILQSLKGQILPVLTSSVKDLVDTEKAEVKSFLEDNALEMAKQTYYSVNGTDDEKAQAPDNMAALKAQAVIEACDIVIVSSAKILAMIVKVLETVGNFLIQNAPAILAAIPK